jgi:hypothetical protein
LFDPVRLARIIIYIQKKKQPTLSAGKVTAISDGLNNTSSNPSARLVFLYQKHFFPFCYPVVRWSLLGEARGHFYVYEFDDEGINQENSRTSEEAFSGALGKIKHEAMTLQYIVNPWK